MLVTVTANTTLDHILFVPAFEMNTTMRASRVLHSMGGKPTDAAWILGRLGVPSLALGFAAGPLGDTVRGMLTERGVTVDFVAVAGETRRNIIIISEAGGEATITDRSLKVSSADVAELRRRYVAALPAATVVLLGGSLPDGCTPDLYIDFIQLARKANRPVIFDAGGAALAAGLTAVPDFIKPNQVELAAATGERVASVADAYRVGLAVRERTGVQPIITLGAAGGLAVLRDVVYQIAPPAVPVVNTAGAGDGVLAGLAHALLTAAPVEDGLRLGFALAAAIIAHPRTADFDPAKLAELQPQIQLRPISSGAELVS